MTLFLKERKEACKQVIKKLKEKYQYVSILGVDTDGWTINIDKYSTNIADSSVERGFVIKVYDGLGYLEYACGDINDSNVNDIVTAVLDCEIKRDDTLRVNASLISDEKLTKEFERVDEEEVTIDEVLPALNSYLKVAFEYDTVINAYCVFEEMNVNKMFLTENKDLYQSYPWRSARVLTCSRRDDNIKNAYKGCGGKDGRKVLNELKDLIIPCCELSKALLDALTIKPGVYDVITDPSITGLIAHEAFGHGVEMDMFVKNRAKAVHYVDKYVASPIVSMHDGAASCYCVASYFFDDDGVLAQDTEIIKDGILKRGISDALSAMQLKTKPTGNGRRQMFTHKAYTRMTNTFFVPGHDKLEDMIASVKYGFYIVDTNNGMEDPKNWQIQCVACYAKEIKDGKFTGKIYSPVVMSGYVLDLLKSITMISDDFKVDGGGFCGKGHKEWVRVSDGGPCLKAKVRLG